MKRGSTLKKNLTLTLELHDSLQSSYGRGTVFTFFSSDFLRFRLI